MGVRGWDGHEVQGRRAGLQGPIPFVPISDQRRS